MAINFHLHAWDGLIRAIVTVIVHRLGKGGSTWWVATFVLPCWRSRLAPNGKHSVIAKYRPTHTHVRAVPLVLASHKVAVRHTRTDSTNPPFLYQPTFSRDEGATTRSLRAYHDCLLACCLCRKHGLFSTTVNFKIQ